MRTERFQRRLDEEYAEGWRVERLLGSDPDRGYRSRTRERAPDRY